jgi:hypothetical protein
MVSDPCVQISLALLSASPVSALTGRDLHQAAQELARLLDPREVCPACWRLASNGARGGVGHEPDTLCVWG